MKKDRSVFLWIAVGLVFLAVGVYVTFFRTMGMVKTTAEITNIDVVNRGDDNDHIVYVKYTVDGVDYNDVRLDTWVSTYKVGKNVTVYYDPDDPSQIHGKSFFVGGMAIFCGLIALCAPILQKRSM